MRGTGLLALAGVLGVGLSLGLGLGRRGTGAGGGSPASGTGCPRLSPILLVGDSNAVGYDPFLRKLATTCGASGGGAVYASDVSGGKGAPYFRPRVAALVGAHRPAVVVVNLGPNDYLRTDPENVRDAVRAVATTVRESGARLVWIEPPSMPAWLEDRNGVRAMWEAEEPTVFRASKYADVPHASDGIHYGPNARAEIARRIWGFLLELS